MALNIDVVNSTVINVYETGGVPRSYFGGFGASGKFYPSGTSGAIVNQAWEVVVNTTNNIPDGFYDEIASTSTSSSGVPDVKFQFDVTDGVIVNSSIQIFNTPITSGYAIGDTFTIQANALDALATGEVVLRITELEIDGLLIVIGGDFYETKWNNLVVGGTSPSSLSDAQELLANLFSTL